MQSLRAKSRQGLREFCAKNGFDPGNVSRIERGIFPPPQDEDKLKKYALALGLQPSSSDWDRFFDLAAIENGRLPSGMAEHKDLARILPLLCRTLQNRPLTPDKLQRLIEMIREG
jgi:transcriptional regulator with XRE-family HTH domain